MRIAQIAPLIESVPPALYGGTERVVAHLTDGLVDLGHKVTLFASGDSRTRADLVAIVPRSLRLDPQVQEYLPYTYIQLDRVMRQAHEFDIVHFHVDLIQYVCAQSIASRMLTTLHGRLDLPDLQRFYRHFPHFPLVSISDAQRAPMPPVNWLATVQHGIPRDLLRFSPEPGKYFAFLGRFAREKRPDRAIRIAEATGMPLKMAAKVDRADRDYFDSEIRPLLENPLVEWIGEIGDSDKSGFLGGARALLFPVDWPEPFGLVLIEAMACGTPVIAFRRGSVPEIVEHGITGFIVDTMQEAVDAARRIGELSRARIRQRFEERFTSERMARDYVAIYESLVLGVQPCLAAE